MCDPGDEKYQQSWDGTGGEVTRLEYLRYADGFVRGLSTLDKDRGVIRLWRALRGVAQTRLRDVDFEKLCATKGENELVSGWDAYCKELKLALPESTLRQLPRLYRAFFADVQWKQDMETLIRDLERAAAKLTEGDPNTTISDGMLGYWTLVKARLHHKEIKHLIGLAQGKLDLSRLREHLIELYLRGSYERQGAYDADADYDDDVAAALAWDEDEPDEDGFLDARDYDPAWFADWYGWPDAEQYDEAADEDPEELVYYSKSEDKELAAAAKAAHDAYAALESADMNFVQAQRHFRAVQRSRGFKGPSKDGGKKGGKKGGKRRGKFGKASSSKGDFGKPSDGYMADPYAWGDSWSEGWSDGWHDAPWSQEEDALAAQYGVRCSDCGRLGHSNAGSAKCPRHGRSPAASSPQMPPRVNITLKGPGKGPRRPSKGGGKGKFRSPRPNRMAVRSIAGLLRHAHRGHAVLRADLRALLRSAASTRVGVLVGLRQRAEPGVHYGWRPCSQRRPPTVVRG